MLPRDILARIIKDFQEVEIPDLIEREYEIPLELPIKRVISIIGPRRSGKTYLFFQLIKKLIEKGINRERILYVNFESDILMNATLDDLCKILEIYYEIYPENKGKKVWLFLDEIQNIPGWERWVRSVLDRENVQVYVTGSSSKLLSKEIATQLRGRSLTYRIFPFSFKEFLKARKFESKHYLSSSEKARLLNLLSEFLEYGGYPEAVIYSKERDKILGEIIEVTFYRDLIERHRIKNLKLIRLMFSQLVSSKYFSVHKFFNFLKSQGLKISKNTLYTYLDYFHDSLIVFPLKKFSFSCRKIEQSIPKIYVADNGILKRYGIEDKSKFLENLVFLEFLKLGEEENNTLFYFSSNNSEVDFVVKRGGKIEKLIQVSYDVENYEVREREIKSLLKASKELKCKNLVVITWDYEAEEMFKNRKIKFIPFWKWILNF